MGRTHMGTCGVRACILLGGLSLWACSSEGVRPIGVPIDTFGPEYATAVCAELTPCCEQTASHGADAGDHDGDAGAVGDADAAGDSDCQARLEAMIARTIEAATAYHAEEARECLDDRQSAEGCGRFEPNDRCDAVLGQPLLDVTELDARGVPDGLCAP